ncbi:MAG: carboxypeptidase regulatory-like domain-containing protein [Planctomycetes bacterium]|nr:carboxypeptidase regulatory-like domain-containing protein [Planctomycetota bacterium]MBL7009114.1 carboxypeptidase regulatory-like domain-containing protein [Planctomycetota bacterium]
MKKYLLLLVLAVAGLALAPSLNAAGHHFGGVAGIVLDSSGNPVPDAMVGVEVHTPNGRIYQARTHTDRRGRFSFQQVPAGPGVVKAHKRGVGHGQVRGKVIAGQVVRARIVLR